MKHIFTLIDSKNMSMFIFQMPLLCIPNIGDNLILSLSKYTLDLGTVCERTLDLRDGQWFFDVKKSDNLDQEALTDLTRYLNELHD